MISDKKQSQNKTRKSWGPRDLRIFLRISSVKDGSKVGDVAVSSPLRRRAGSHL